MPVSYTEKQIAALARNLAGEAPPAPRKAAQQPAGERTPRTSAPAGMPRGWAAATDRGWQFRSSAIGGGRVHTFAEHPATGRTLGPFADPDSDGYDQAVAAALEAL